MDTERILLGSSIPVFEVEEDFDRDLAGEASLKYDLLNIINAIGTDNFKQVYLSSIQSVQEELEGFPEIQEAFFTELSEKIKQVYNFEFPVKLDFSNKGVVKDFYEFVEFLEFNYIEFLAKLWSFLNVDLRSLDIDSFCRDHPNLVTKEVDEIVDIGSFNQLVAVFLRTYTKEDLVTFVIKKTTKDRMLIILTIKEGDQKWNQENTL